MPLIRYATFDERRRRHAALILPYASFSLLHYATLYAAASVIIDTLQRSERADAMPRALLC